MTNVCVLSAATTPQGSPSVSAVCSGHYSWNRLRSTDNALHIKCSADLTGLRGVFGQTRLLFSLLLPVVSVSIFHFPNEKETILHISLPPGFPPPTADAHADKCSSARQQQRQRQRQELKTLLTRLKAWLVSP